MDCDAAGMNGIEIGKFTETKFHEWRQRLNMVRGLRDLGDMLDEEGRPTDVQDREFALWKRRDMEASATIGLTLGSEQLELVSRCTELWSMLRGVFLRKSLMNKMKARREFHTFEMNLGEGMPGNTNSVRNLGGNLKVMGSEVTKKDAAMSVLNGLTTKYEKVPVALDSEGEDELRLDFVKIRMLQEERRQAAKKPAIERIGFMALVVANYRDQGHRGGSFKIELFNCHKFGYTSYDFPLLEANKQSEDKMVAIAADEGINFYDAICLVGNAADHDNISKSRFVDSAASAHMCYMRACFGDYETITARSLKMGDDGPVVTTGVGTVVMNVIVHGRTRKINSEKALNVPTMGSNLLAVGMAEERGAEVLFEGEKAIVKIGDKVTACATRKSGLYHLDMAQQSAVDSVAFLQLWYERLPNVNVAGVERIIKRKNIDGFK